MNFTCLTNRPTSIKKWNSEGNTTVSDGYSPASATFGNRAKDETIIREYLRGCAFNSEDGTYNTDWMEMSIRTRPGNDDYNVTFYVRLSANGKWATVTDRMPVGELRCDGYRF